MEAEYPVEVVFSNQSNQIISIFNYKIKPYEHDLKAFEKPFILNAESDSPEFRLKPWAGFFLASSQGPYEIIYFHNRLGYRGMKLDKIRKITPEVNINNIANPSKVLIIINPDGTVQMVDRANINN